MSERYPWLQTKLDWGVPYPSPFDHDPADYHSPEESQSETSEDRMSRLIHELDELLAEEDEKKAGKKADTKASGEADKKPSKKANTFEDERNRTPSSSVKSEASWGKLSQLIDELDDILCDDYEKKADKKEARKPAKKEDKKEDEKENKMANGMVEKKKQKYEDTEAAMKTDEREERRRRKREERRRHRMEEKREENMEEKSAEEKRFKRVEKRRHRMEENREENSEEKMEDKRAEEKRAEKNRRKREEKRRQRMEEKRSESTEDMLAEERKANMGADYTEAKSVEERRRKREKTRNHRMEEKREENMEDKSTEERRLKREKKRRQRKEQKRSENMDDKIEDKSAGERRLKREEKRRRKLEKEREENKEDNRANNENRKAKRKGDKMEEKKTEIFQEKNAVNRTKEMEDSRTDNGSLENKLETEGSEKRDDFLTKKKEEKLEDMAGPSSRNSFNVKRFPWLQTKIDWGDPLFSPFNMDPADYQGDEDTESLRGRRSPKRIPSEDEISILLWQLDDLIDGDAFVKKQKKQETRRLTPEDARAVTRCTYIVPTDRQSTQDKALSLSSMKETDRISAPCSSISSYESSTGSNDRTQPSSIQGTTSKRSRQEIYIKRPEPTSSTRPTVAVSTGSENTTKHTGLGRRLRQFFHRIFRPFRGCLGGPRRKKQHHN